MAFFKNFFEKVIEIAKFFPFLKYEGIHFKHLEKPHNSPSHPRLESAPLEKANKSWVAPTGRDDPAGHNDTSALDASQHRAARHQHVGERILYGLVATGKRAQLRSQSLWTVQSRWIHLVSIGSTTWNFLERRRIGWE